MMLALFFHDPAVQRQGGQPNYGLLSAARDRLLGVLECLIAFRFEMWIAIQGRRLSHLDVAVISDGRMRVNRAAVHASSAFSAYQFLTEGDANHDHTSKFFSG
jgi:hypothetical protein